MNIYKARYLNALKKAAKINRYLKKGYHVFHRGETQKHGFFMRDNQILLKYSEYSCMIYFQNDKDWDHGMHTKISDFNKQFNEDFEVYQPMAKMVL